MQNKTPQENRTSKAVFRWLTVDSTIRPEDVDAICKKYQRIEMALRGMVLTSGGAPGWKSTEVAYEKAVEALAFDPLSHES